MQYPAHLDARKGISSFNKTFFNNNIHVYGVVPQRRIINPILETIFWPQTFQCGSLFAAT